MESNQSGTPQSPILLTVALVNAGVRPTRARQFANPLALAMQEFDIITPLQQSAFLANGLYETLMLRYLREIWGPTIAQEKYRIQDSSVKPGDDHKYRSSGFIRMPWGVSYYKSIGKAIGVDLENNPALIEDPTVASRSAGCFWLTRGLNAVLENGGFSAVVKSLNGDFNGIEKRERLFVLLKRDLGVA